MVIGQKKIKRFILFVFIISIVFLLPPLASAKIWYVDDNASPGGNGTDWSEAFQDIQTAIDRANPNWMHCYAPFDSIYVRAGTYSLTATININRVVNLYGGFPSSGNPTMVDRDWQANETIVDGNNLRRCMTSRSFFKLDGFTIRNGKTLWAGAGLYVRKDPVDCNFMGYLSPIIKNCTFINNTARDGGAVMDDRSDLEIVNCQFINNRATQDGGAIDILYSSPVIEKCVFTGNTAAGDDAGTGHGGAIHGFWANQITESIAYIKNSIFHDNSGSYGGAYYSYHMHPRFWNCTFFDNSAEYSGGGFYAIPSDKNPADFSNSILWGNFPNQLDYTISDATFLGVDYCNIQGGWPDGSHNIGQNPQFASATDLHLTQDSPCIDSGRSFTNLNDDLEGTARPQDGDGDGVAKYDMGAYEYIYEGFIPDSDKDGDADGFDLASLANDFDPSNLKPFASVFGNIN